MMNAQEVAARMLERLETRRELLRSDAINLITDACGDVFTFVDDSGTKCIAQPVLHAFKRLHCGRAKWDRVSGRWYLASPEEGSESEG